MATTRQLLIIYNADSTLLGKVSYVCRKVSGSGGNDSKSGEKAPACAACEITHGGLSLKEVPGWKDAKAEIEATGWNVRQWHRDEVEKGVAEWMKAENVLYPVVLAREGDQLKVVMDKGELAGCSGDPKKFNEALRAKGYMG